MQSAAEEKPFILAPSTPASKQKSDESSALKIWHWNVNGLKLVLKRKTLQSFLKVHSPTILCLNETKLSESDIGEVRKKLSPYFSHMHFACATNRRNYSGVAILYCADKLREEAYSKASDEEGKGEEQDLYDMDNGDLSVTRGISASEEDRDLDIEGRVIAKEFATFILVSVYTPHSGVGDLKRLDYRVERWDRAFEAYINRLKEQTGKSVIVCGDLNIIRHEQDIYNPKTKGGRPGLTDRERNSFEQILSNCDLQDSFRKLYPLRMLVYSHWTDRCGIARKNNWGSRMDYFLSSGELKARVRDVKYQSQIEGSDHCPVTLELRYQSDLKKIDVEENLAAKQDEEQRDSSDKEEEVGMAEK